MCGPPCESPGLAQPGSLTASFLPEARPGHACPRPVSMKRAADGRPPPAPAISGMWPWWSAQRGLLWSPRLCRVGAPDPRFPGLSQSSCEPHTRTPQEDAGLTPPSGENCYVSPQPFPSRRAGLGLRAGRTEGQRGERERVASVQRQWAAEQRKRDLDSQPPTRLPRQRVGWGRPAEVKKPGAALPFCFLDPRSHLADGPVALLGPSPRPCGREINRDNGGPPEASSFFPTWAMNNNNTRILKIVAS